MNLNGLNLSIAELGWSLRGILKDLLLRGQFRRILYLLKKELLDDRFHSIFSICEDLVREEWEPLKI